jgi:hypothetical protein
MPPTGDATESWNAEEHLFVRSRSVSQSMMVSPGPRRTLVGALGSPLVRLRNATATGPGPWGRVGGGRPESVVIRCRFPGRPPMRSGTLAFLGPATCQAAYAKSCHDCSRVNAPVTAVHASALSVQRLRAARPCRRQPQTSVLSDERPGAPAGGLGEHRERAGRVSTELEMTPRSFRLMQRMHQ